MILFCINFYSIEIEYGVEDNYWRYAYPSITEEERCKTAYFVPKLSG
jgi:hypothetical protein